MNDESGVKTLCRLLTTNYQLPTTHYPYSRQPVRQNATGGRLRDFPGAAARVFGPAAAA